MGSYRKHILTLSKQIPYEFRCERCHQNSGELTAVFEGKSTETKYLLAKLSDEEKQQMRRGAENALNTAIQSARKNAEEKEEYSPEIKDKCPHCGKPQSWAVKGLERLPRVYGLSCAFWTALLCITSNIAHWFGFTIPVIVIVALTAIAGLTGMAVGYARVKVKKMKTRHTEDSQIPTIYWPETE